MSHDNPISAQTLREQAERELRDSPLPEAGMEETNPAALLYELQVHQIELEHQNEELRRALLEAEEARARYLELYDFAPVGYFSFDRQGLIREVNLTGAALLGVARGRLIGRRFGLFVHPDYQGHFAALLRRVFESPDKRVMDLRLLRQGGEAFHVQLEGAAAPADAGGEAPGEHFRAAIMDITAQKLAQDEVLRLNETLEARVEQRSAQVRALGEELERFTYDVANDLQGPLRQIQSFVALLRGRGSPDDGLDQQQLEHIEHAATRMQGLTAALIEFSRASRMRTRPAQVPLEQVLREVRKKLEPELSARRVQLSHESLPVVRADSGAMQLVFRHLLTNALKFTRQQPEARIWVFAQDLPREHVIGVRDNGVGFNMRYRDRLFNVFQRLHSGREYEGAGVGLAIVRRMVTRSGGRVWAEGKVGEGATFYVALPKQPAEPD